ncbi:hypothetical protein IW148_004664 [Coemansia sp. RSA 1199]|nr:hypothetical protein IW148_004664 [Coemansia sp. RSA 1199]
MTVLELAQTFSTNGTYLLTVPGNMESATPYMQYVPHRTVAYGIGGGFGALALSMLVVLLLNRAPVFSIAVVSSTSLLASQFLRGSLSDPHDLTMYQISLVLNTFGAQLLLAMATLMLARWVRFAGARRWAVVVVAGFGVLLALGASVLTCVGVPLAFHTSPNLRQTAHVLLVSAAASTLGAGGAGLAVTAWTAAMNVQQRMGIETAILALPYALLCVWASFALAQAKLPLQNVANTSEVVFYVLNLLPLALVLITWTVSNAPRRFTFDLPSYGTSQRGITRLDTHYEYPSLPADHDFSYPLRVHPDMHRMSTKDAALYPHPTSSSSSEKLGQSTHSGANGDHCTSTYSNDGRMQQAFEKYA